MWGRQLHRRSGGILALSGTFLFWWVPLGCELDREFTQPRRITFTHASRRHDCNSEAVAEFRTLFAHLTEICEAPTDAFTDADLNAVCDEIYVLATAVKVGANISGENVSPASTWRLGFITPISDDAKWSDLLPLVFQARVLQSFENANLLRQSRWTASAPTSSS
jgi:hypothetical protein